MSIRLQTLIIRILTLVSPAKMHMKTASDYIVCCIFLLTLAYLSIKTNSVDPDRVAPKGAD